MPLTDQQALECAARFISTEQVIGDTDAKAIAERLREIGERLPGISPPEVRRNDAGAVDEIVGIGTFHLEQLSGGVWWLSVGGVTVHLTSRRRITAMVEGTSEEARRA